MTSGFSKKREELVSGEGRYVSMLMSSLLSKPYNRSGLAAAIRSVLDSSADYS